jgi:hypothetical protein
MKAQAEELGQAIVANDHERIVDGTHPKIIEKAGGRDQMIALLEFNAQQMKSNGSTIQSVSFDTPADLAEGGAELFGIIRYSLVMTVRGRQANQRFFLIGVSEDGGRIWKFVDGGQADLAKVRKLFPNFPGQLRLPEKEPLVVSDKKAE